MTESQDTQDVRHLVVPVDGSEDTKRPIQWMLDNLHREGDMVHIIHVVSDAVMLEGAAPVWIGSFDAPFSMLQNDDSAVQKGLDMVNATVAPLLEPRKVAYRIHILTHSTNTSGIAAALSAKAKELHAHSVVMTHHRKSGLSAWFLGSVCKELINQGVETPLVFVH